MLIYTSLRDLAGMVLLAAILTGSAAYIGFVWWQEKRAKRRARGEAR